VIFINRSSAIVFNKIGLKSLKKIKMNFGNPYPQCAIDISWMSNGLPKWDVSNWTSNGSLMDFKNGMCRIGHPMDVAWIS